LSSRGLGAGRPELAKGDEAALQVFQIAF